MIRKVESCVLLLCLYALYVAGHETNHHHLYRPNHAPDSCVSDSLSSKYWAESASAEGLDSTGRSLIGTSYAVNAIDALQHPKDCKAANFLLWIPVRHGIGSDIHCLGQALAHALSLDRIFILLRDDGHPFYDTNYCKPEEDHHTCYFEPISNCTIEDARLVAGHQLADLTRVPEILYDWPDRTQPHGQSEARVIKLTGIPKDEKQVPQLFHLFLSSSTIRPNKHYYWWRAVSAAYIVRPNARTLVAIEDRRRAIYPEMSVPHGAIAVHVRHGDKGSETHLLDNQQYLQAVEELIVQQREQWALSRNIFLSTEDAMTADFFKSLPDWNVTFTQVHRYHATNISPMDWAAKIGKSIEMLNSLTSLDLALQCNAFVLTLSSNWCRLIDELRATVRCKADHPLWDAQQTNILEEYDLDWR